MADRARAEAEHGNAGGPVEPCHEKWSPRNEAGAPALMLWSQKPALEISMKIKATIEVEFEMDRGQPENAANSALARGAHRASQSHRARHHEHANRGEARVGESRGYTPGNYSLGLNQKPDPRPQGRE